MPEQCEILKEKIKLLKICQAFQRNVLFLEMTIDTVFIRRHKTAENQNKEGEERERLEEKSRALKEEISLVKRRKEGKGEAGIHAALLPPYIKRGGQGEKGWTQNSTTHAEDYTDHVPANLSAASGSVALPAQKSIAPPAKKGRKRGDKKESAPKASLQPPGINQPPKGGVAKPPPKKAALPGGGGEKIEEPTAGSPNDETTQTQVLRKKEKRKAAQTVPSKSSSQPHGGQRKKALSEGLRAQGRKSPEKKSVSRGDDVP
ncbi:hypothetical protein KM043_016622 [Ampulex compressa]|nr:hypothetical protein KM043_016622 [Ampulex compressa]